MKYRILISVILITLLSSLCGLAQENILTPEQLEQRAKQSEWLLKKWALLSWSGPAYSGGIEFKLEPDGYISGYIFDPPEELQEMGYDNGMKILHGYVDTSSNLHSGATWSNQAQGFWFYRPTTRKRHSKKLPAQWIQSKRAIIFLEKKTGHLKGSSLIANRPNWYTGKYIAKDLRPLEAQLEEYLAGQRVRVEQLSLAGSDEERMAAAQQIVEDLAAFSDIRDVRRAIAVLTLLQERREIMLSSELEDAIQRLENSENPAAESEALQTFRAEILRRGAHFSRALRNMTLNRENAARLFLAVNEGLRLREDLGRIEDAPLPERVTTLNRSLGTLFGVANTVQGVQNEDSGQLVEGLRGLINNVPATKSLSALDIPVEIVGRIIGFTRDGLGAITGAVTGIRDAIEGRPGGMAQAFAQARESQRIISQQSYVDAIVGGISSRVPLFGKLIGWYR